MRLYRIILSAAFCHLTFLANVPLSFAQSEAEHLSHHPELAAQATAARNLVKPHQDLSVAALEWRGAEVLRDLPGHLAPLAAAHLQERRPEWRRVWET